MIKSESPRALRCWPVHVCRGSAPSLVGTLDLMTTLEGRPGLRDGNPGSERLSHLLSRRASERWTQPGVSGLCSAVSSAEEKGDLAWKGQLASSTWRGSGIPFVG